MRDHEALKATYHSFPKRQSDLHTGKDACALLLCICLKDDRLGAGIGRLPSDFDDEGFQRRTVERIYRLPRISQETIDLAYADHRPCSDIYSLPTLRQKVKWSAVFLPTIRSGQGRRELDSYRAYPNIQLY